MEIKDRLKVNKIPPTGLTKGRRAGMFKDISSTMRKWRKGLTASFLLLLAMLGCLALLMGSYINRIVDDQKQQLSLITDTVSSVTQALVSEYIQDLDAFADLDMVEAAEEQYINGKPENLKHLLETYQADRYGILEKIASLDDIQHMYDFTYINDMGLSDGLHEIAVVTTADQRCFLQITRKSAAGCSLVYLLNLRELYEETIADITIGTKGHITVKDNNGMIIMHSDRSQIGTLLLENRKELYPHYDFSDLEHVMEQQNNGEAGVEIYNSYWWEENIPYKVKKITAFAPAYIGSKFLTVSTSMDYEELASPTREGVAGLMLISAIFVSGFLAMVFFLYQSATREETTKLENERLKELNDKLTEINQKEEQLAHEQRLQTIGTLTGGIAHEFSNLLTPIMGYSSMLLAGMEITDENYEDMETIYTFSVKAKEIIDQITSYSGKHAEQTYHNILLDDTIRQSASLIENIKPKNVKVESHIGELHARILGNATQIQQVILNLCTNAFHAMEGSDGVLQIDYHLSHDTADLVSATCISPVCPAGSDVPATETADRCYACIAISDTGCGMSPETLKQIFDPFFTTKKVGEGTGLGLSIVYRIIESHGGRINVSSTEGTGTTFTIYLPFISQ